MLNQSIIKAALLGLKSNKIDKTIFHPKVQNYLSDASDEILFLNGLSLSFQYFNTGKELMKIEKLGSQMPICPEEELSVVDAPWIRALSTISKEDFLSLNYYSFLRILAEKVLAQHRIFPADKMIKVLTALQEVRSREQRRLGFKRFYKTFVDRKLYQSFDELEAVVVASFGVSGSWIYKMMNGSDEVDLDELNAQKRLVVFKEYWFSDKQKAISFLEGFYEHETPTNQKKILSSIGQTLTMDDKDVYSFFESFFENNSGKRIDILRRYFETVKLFAGLQSAHNQLVESVFEKIWAKKGLLKKSLELLPSEQLESILAPLSFLEMDSFVDADGLQGLDLKLFFLLQIVPVERATQLLNVKLEKYIKAISEIKSLEKNKSFDLLRALLRNVLKNKNKKIALAILAQSKRSNGSYVELLLLFSDLEIYNFLEKNFAIIDNSELDVFEILVKELNCQETWPKKLTRLMLNRLLTHQHFYSYADRRNQALWLGGPFYHKDVMQIVDQLINLDEHKGAWKTGEIQSIIQSIDIAKSAFNNALNQ